MLCCHVCPPVTKLSVAPQAGQMAAAHLSGVLAPKTPEWPSSTRWFRSRLFTWPDRSSIQFCARRCCECGPAALLTRVSSNLPHLHQQE